MADRAQSGGGKSTPVPQGLVESITAAIKSTYDVWFGPGLPNPQNSPDTTKPRELDYPVHYNINRTPRAGEQISFGDLRNLADRCDILRLIIETRKDQVEAQHGEFALVEKEGASAAGEEKADTDPRIQALNDFFKYPDKEHSWRQWLRMFLEDVLVIDAPALWMRPQENGDLYSLQLLDGSTIKRVIDDVGATPVAPAVGYQQIIKGVVAYEFTTDDMVYRPRNPRVHKVYGMSPVEQVIVTANIGLRRMSMQLSYYTDGNIPLALIKVPETWTAEQIRRGQEWFDALLSGNTTNRSKGILIPPMDPVFPQHEVLKDEFDEWLARIVCFAFSITPTPFIKQMNRATAESSAEQATEEGLQPLLNYVKDFLDYIIQIKLGFTDIEWNWKTDKEVDPFKQAQIDCMYVDKGIRSRDEVREDRGWAAIGVGPAVTIANGIILLDDAKKASALLGEPPEPEPTNNQNTNQNQGKQKLLVGEVEKADKKKVFRVEGRPTSKKAVAAEQKLRKYLERFLRKQARVLSKKIKDAYAKTKKADDTDPFSFLDKLNWREIVDVVETTLYPVVDEAGEVVVSNFSPDAADDVYNLLNTRALEFASERAAELVGMQRRGDGSLVVNPHPQFAITDVTRQRLREIIQQAFTDGLTPAQLSQAIQDSGLFAESRADLIARTEVGNAHIGGSLLGAEISGNVTKKKSILSNLHDHDDECDEAAADGWIPVGNMFSNGMFSPLFHPNCECALLLDNDD